MKLIKSSTLPDNPIIYNRASLCKNKESITIKYENQASESFIVSSNDSILFTLCYYHQEYNFSYTYNWTIYDLLVLNGLATHFREPLDNEMNIEQITLNLENLINYCGIDQEKVNSFLQPIAEDTNKTKLDVLIEYADLYLVRIDGYYINQTFINNNWLIDIDIYNNKVGGVIFNPKNKPLNFSYSVRNRIPDTNNYLLYATKNNSGFIRNFYNTRNVSINCPCSDGDCEASDSKYPGYQCLPCKEFIAKQKNIQGIMEEVKSILKDLN